MKSYRHLVIQENFLAKKKSHLNTAVSACEAMLSLNSTRASRIDLKNALHEALTPENDGIIHEEELRANRSAEVLASLAAFVQSTKSASVFERKSLQHEENTTESQRKSSYSKLLTASRAKPKDYKLQNVQFTDTQQKQLSLMLLRPVFVSLDSLVLKDMRYFFQRFLIAGSLKLPNERLSILDIIYDSCKNVIIPHAEHAQGFVHNAAILDSVGRFEDFGRIASQREVSQFRKNLATFMLLFIQGIKVLVRLGSNSLGINETETIFAKLSFIDYIYQNVKKFTLILGGFVKKRTEDSPYLLYYFHLLFASEIIEQLLLKLKTLISGQKYSRIVKDITDTNYDPMILGIRNLKIRLYHTLRLELEQLFNQKLDARFADKAVISKGAIVSESLGRLIIEDVKVVVSQYQKIKAQEAGMLFSPMADRELSNQIECRLLILLLQIFLQTLRMRLLQAKFKFRYAQIMDLIKSLEQFVTGEVYSKWFEKDASQLQVLYAQREFVQFRSLLKVTINW